MKRHALLMIAAVGLVLVGCGDSAGSSSSDDNGGDPPSANSADGTWLLVSIDDGPVLPGSRVDLTIDGNQASGYTGCNQFNAAVTVDGDSLSFGPITRTEMACGGAGIMQQETDFFTVIEGINDFTINDSGQLLLVDSSGQARLVFDVGTETGQ